MAHVELDIDTPLSPERVISGLTDLSERRPEIWPGLHPSLYEVHSVVDTWAEVKEGSWAPGMTVWAIEHYDLSVPDTVTWTVKESNFCTGKQCVGAGATRPRQQQPDPCDVESDRSGLQGLNAGWDYQAERRQAGSSLDQSGLRQDAQATTSIRQAS